MRSPVADLTADVDVTVRAPSTPTGEWLTTLEQHVEQALGQSDLISAFEQCLLRARA